MLRCLFSQETGQSSKVVFQHEHIMREAKDMSDDTWLTAGPPSNVISTQCVGNIPREYTARD